MSSTAQNEVRALRVIDGRALLAELGEPSGSGAEIAAPDDRYARS